MMNWERKYKKLNITITCPSTLVESRLTAIFCKTSFSKLISNSNREVSSDVRASIIPSTTCNKTIFKYMIF